MRVEHGWENPAETITNAREALRGNPTHLDYNNVAWLLATCPDPQYRAPDEAVRLAKRAIDLAPREQTYWNTLGAAHYRAGEWRDAIVALQRSMKLQGVGGDGYDFFLLAMAHWQLGDKVQARQQYEKAIRWKARWKDMYGEKNEEINRLRAEAAGLLGLTNTDSAPREGPSTSQN